MKLGRNQSRRTRRAAVRARSESVENWLSPNKVYQKKIEHNVVLQTGWGKLVFANTYTDQSQFIEDLRKEIPGQRNLAFYPSDPHVAVSLAPNEVFLDPSHTFRIPFENYKPAKRTNSRIFVRRLTSKKDLESVNRILLSRNMIPLKSEYVLNQSVKDGVLYLVAESTKTGSIVGFVNGVDHAQVFNDPEKGTSLWSLAVDPRSALPGIGEALTRYLIEHFATRNRSYLDLSVLHENSAAIQLYRRLGFRRVPVFCVKLKNSINESLYTTRKYKTQLNPYGQIIVNEAMRRGIKVEILDEEGGYFELSFGGRKVACRESLTELTSAIAMSRCTDKAVTSRLLQSHGISVPKQLQFKGDIKPANAFLEKWKSIVVKPTDGEQGQGVKVGITTKKELKSTLDSLSENHNRIVIEQMVEGVDVRIIIIDFKFVAAAIRRPPEVVGDGRSSIRALIQRLNKRKMAATGGESQIPLDDETLRTLKNQKVDFDTKLEEGRILQVRKTTNLHTGGTISDITPQIPDWLKEVSEKAARVLEIPVTGLDFILPDFESKKYWVIEANERPGLANHEPQPTAERFIDFLFPLTRKDLNNHEAEH